VDIQNEVWFNIKRGQWWAGQINLNGKSSFNRGQVRGELTLGILGKKNSRRVYIGALACKATSGRTSRRKGTWGGEEALNPRKE